MKIYAIILLIFVINYMNKNKAAKKLLKLFYGNLGAKFTLVIHKILQSKNKNSLNISYNGDHITINHLSDDITPYLPKFYGIKTTYNSDDNQAKFIIIDELAAISRDIPNLTNYINEEFERLNDEYHNTKVIIDLSYKHHKNPAINAKLNKKNIKHKEQILFLIKKNPQKNSLKIIKNSHKKSRDKKFNLLKKYLANFSYKITRKKHQNIEEKKTKTKKSILAHKFWVRHEFRRKIKKIIRKILVKIHIARNIIIHHNAALKRRATPPVNTTYVSAVNHHNLSNKDNISIKRKQHSNNAQSTLDENHKEITLEKSVLEKENLKNSIQDILSNFIKIFLRNLIDNITEKLDINLEPYETKQPAPHNEAATKNNGAKKTAVNIKYQTRKNNRAYFTTIKAAENQDLSLITR